MIRELTEDEVLAIQKIDFSRFRVSVPLVPPQQNNNINNIPTTKTTTVTSGNNDVKDFVKGTKRDKTQYDILKDERQFDSWYIAILIMARSHEITDALDATYVPNASDKELFEKKLSFTYTVLHHTLNTDMGITLVRKHKDTGNAQKVWSEFNTYMKKSTKGQILSSDLLSWITSARYDNTWKGSTQTFILYWINKVQEYDSYCTTANLLSDELKLQLLQNAVKGVTSLRQVRVNADHAVAEGRSKMTYQQYIPLLL
jgi:hypothetical protein